MLHALVHAVVALRLQAIPLLAPPAASRAAAAPALRLVELNESNFAAEVGAVPGLAVVEFYAPWCRTCRSVAPVFAREVRRMGAEARYERVRFFKVNFKENPRLAMRERVFALPAVHFYSPSLGRINRFTFTRLTAAKRLREEMDRYTGPRGHLETLETLRITPGAVSPLVRFSLMAGFLRALTHLEEYLAEGDDANRAYLQRLVESDPRRVRAPGKRNRSAEERAPRHGCLREQVGELRDLFSLVDRNGDGRIDASELTAVAAAVGGMGGDMGGGEGGGGGGDGVDDFYVTLLEHARTSFAGEAEEGEAEGEAGEAEAGSGSLDFATFVRLMSSKAVSEYKAAARRRPSVCRGWRPFTPAPVNRRPRRSCVPPSPRSTSTAAAASRARRCCERRLFTAIWSAQATESSLAMRCCARWSASGAICRRGAAATRSRSRERLPSPSTRWTWTSRAPSTTRSLWPSFRGYGTRTRSRPCRSDERPQRPLTTQSSEAAGQSSG